MSIGNDSPDKHIGTICGTGQLINRETGEVGPNVLLIGEVVEKTNNVAASTMGWTPKYDANFDAAFGKNRQN